MSFFKYVSFLVKSTNHHGVHSPFVFSFITQCLYAKNIQNQKKIAGISTKQSCLLQQITKYFNSKHILVDEKSFSNFFLNLGGVIVVDDLQSVVLEKQKYDLIFTQNHSEAIPIQNFIDAMHNDSILVVNNLNSTKGQKIWQKLYEHPQTTACIDVFYQGYIFIRKEQKKELFFIRV